MSKLNVNRQSGFSLIELMVVVAIIGILATIAVPNFQRFQNRSRQSEARSALSSLYASEESFRKLYNSYRADFRDVGFEMSGSYGYIVGFPAAGVLPGNNFNPSIVGGTAAGLCFHNHIAGCRVDNAGAALPPVPNSYATATGIALGTAPPAVATVAACGFTVVAAAPTADNFAATAVSKLPNTPAGNDTWGINEQKISCNTNPNF